eukprot:3673816-Rhodomonas_salina.3
MLSTSCFAPGRSLSASAHSAIPDSASAPYVSLSTVNTSPYARSASSTRPSESASPPAFSSSCAPARWLSLERPEMNSTMASLVWLP